jgi:hypothetical protein
MSKLQKNVKSAVFAVWFYAYSLVLLPSYLALKKPSAISRNVIKLTLDSGTKRIKEDVGIVPSSSFSMSFPRQKDGLKSA